jgi:hypothetical protein
MLTMCCCRCDWGLDGAAVAWNCVQATSISGLLCYIWHYNSQQDPDKKTWTGWSRECLSDWGVYIRVAIPSMVMICLDWWTFEVGNCVCVGGGRSSINLMFKDCLSGWGIQVAIPSMVMICLDWWILKVGATWHAKT